MLFLSTIYHCFWKSNCTWHFPMGGECRVQWKRGAVEAGCSSSRAHAGEGVCVHGGMSCCGTWGLGKRLLKVGEKREVGKARSGLGLAELKRAHFPEELVSSTDRITRWVSPSVKRGLRGGRLQKKKVVCEGMECTDGKQPMRATGQRRCLLWSHRRRNFRQIGTSSLVSILGRWMPLSSAVLWSFQP